MFCNMMKRTSCVSMLAGFFGAACALGFAVQAGAATIVVPIGVTASSTATAGAEFSPSYMADGLRLSDTSVNATGNLVPVTWPTFATGGVSVDGSLQHQWRTNLPLPATMTFDLGATYTLTDTFVWNYAEIYQGVYYNNRGIQGLTVSFSTTGPAGTFTDAQPFTLAAATQTLQIAGQLLTFDVPVTANAVKFTMTSNLGGNFSGLSKVRFVSDIPEPASLGLMAISGVGGLMFAGRRRR